MAKTARIIRIFLSSTDDLIEERDTVKDVVDDLHLLWSGKRNIALELVRGETHAIPNAGKDAQSIINEDIGDNYDIFIGVLGNRFGTPTPRYGSGTEEEFNNALSRYKKDPNCVRIMFYFKNELIHPNELDIDQFQKVRDFKQQISDTILFSIFDSIDVFSKQLSLHLSSILLDYDTHSGLEKPESSISKKRENTESETDDEPGILDILTDVEDYLENITKSTKRMTSELYDLANNLIKQTEEIKKLTPLKESISSKKKKSLVNKSAEYMEQFTSQIEHEIPIISINISRLFKNIPELVAFIPSFSIEDRKSFDDNKDMFLILSRGADAVIEMTSPIIDELNELPRLTTRLNRAKKSTALIIEKLNKEYSICSQLANEAHVLLNKLLQE